VGQRDFFVLRAYLHIIANCRGGSGSGGVFGATDFYRCAFGLVRNTTSSFELELT
jgi:hypothetical protein